MALVLSAAVLCRRILPEQKELSRKIVHIGTGPVVPLAWWLQLPGWVAVPAALSVTLITAINHRWRLLPAVEDIDRHSTARHVVNMITGISTAALHNPSLYSKEFIDQEIDFLVGELVR